MGDSQKQTGPAFRLQPLVPAAAVWIAGIALGRILPLPPVWIVGSALFLWILWLIIEWRGPTRRLSGAALALAILFSGAGVWAANQAAVRPEHLGRLAGDVERTVTVRVRVEVPPQQHGPGLISWLGSAQALSADGRWAPTAGRVRVRTRADVAVNRGDLLELHGWLRRPPGPENPGATDLRALLAADRVFAEIRVPRASGVLPIEHGGGGESWLTRVRAYLRAKLLEHTVREDVEAGYAMEALLLGMREPVIDDVTRAFSDAGVAHLLAISGAHVVFVAGVVWMLLRMIPMRPRWRELAVAAVVIGYVLATPCGPPVMRAAVGVVMVAIARLLGRPRVTLNMLAAAAVVVLLWRPADVLDAGFQLSFVGTAGLIVFAERRVPGLFGAWLEREKALAGLAGTWWARAQVRVLKVACGLVVANGIGVAATMPLVALHFRQVNPLGLLTGMIALPAVALAMMASALQVGVELASATAAAWLAPLTVLAGRAMVWVVVHLAMLPGAAVSVRAPAWWVVAAVYGAWVAWGLRRRLGITRATLVNLSAVAWVLVVGWYALTMQVGELRMEVLRVGIGSAMVVRMPDGAVWVADAGSRESLTPMERSVMPALRVEGVRRIDGLLVTALDEVHGRDAARVIERYAPRQVVVPAAAWKTREWTRVGGAVETAAGPRVRLIDGGEEMTANGARVTSLGEGVTAWEFAGRRVIVGDGKAVGGLWRFLESGQPCDAIVVTGAEGREMAELLARARAPVVRAGSVLRVQWGGVRVEAF